MLQNSQSLHSSYLARHQNPRNLSGLWVHTARQACSTMSPLVWSTPMAPSRPLHYSWGTQRFLIYEVTAWEIPLSCPSWGSPLCSQQSPGSLSHKPRTGLSPLSSAWHLLSGCFRTWAAVCGREAWWGQSETEPPVPGHATPPPQCRRPHSFLQGLPSAASGQEGFFLPLLLRYPVLSNSLRPHRS